MEEMILGAEKALFDYIKNHLNEDNECFMNDIDLAKELGVSVPTLRTYRKKLKLKDKIIAFICYRYRQKGIVYKIK